VRATRVNLSRLWSFLPKCKYASFILKFSILLAVLLGPMAYALDTSIEAGTTVTSSDFRAQELDARVDPTRGYGFSFSDANGKVQGLNFNLAQLAAHATQTAEDFNFVEEVSMYTRSISGRQATQYPGGNLEGSKKFGESSSIKIDLGQTSFAQDLQTSYSMSEALRGPYYRLSSQIYLAKAWRLNGSVRQIFLSDANDRSQQEAELMYGLSPGWPWIWVGFGGDNHRHDLQQWFVLESAPVCHLWTTY
jgi:hypothetical protein